MPAPFDLSKLSSVQEPWGPSSTIPASLTFNDVPYAPFSKSDKLGKVADWQQAKDEEQLKQQQQKNQNQKKRDQYHAYGASAAKLFGAEAEEEEFSVVDNSATPAYKQQQQQQQQSQTAVLRGRKQPSNTKQTTKPTQDGGNKQTQRPYNNRYNNRYSKDDQNVKVREPSVKIAAAWKLVSEIEMNKFSKLHVDVNEISDVSTYGSVNAYQKKFESFKPEILKPSTKTTVNTTTSQDPIIKSLAASKSADIFATDSILAQLMCSARSSYPWDIVVTKKDGIISFDKRDAPELLEVDENTSNSPFDSTDELNNAAKLSQEATEVNLSFVANSLDAAPVHKFEHPENPFASQSSTPLLNTGYKYRKFILPSSSEPEQSASVIVRCQVDSIQNGKLVSINALNQYAPQPTNDWKTKLGSGTRGVIFAEELKKNNNKISKWITKSMLGGVDLIKIGFVARSNAKDTTKHVVAGTLSYTPETIASQINLSINNGWGIIKSLVDIMDHEGGDEDYKFLILKDPNAPKLSIYKLPLTAFEDN